MSLKQRTMVAAICAVSLVFSNSVNAQSNFFKSYINQDGNISNSLVILDQGFALGGWYNVDGILSSEYYLSVLDSTGQLKWSKTYGEKVAKKAKKKHEGGNECFYIDQSMDGGFFLLGEVHGFGAGQSDVYAVKTDRNGDTLWSKTYGSRAVDYCNSGVENSDSGYTIAGFTEGFNARERNAYVLRLNKYGDTMWTKTIGAPNAEAILEIQHTLDDNYILVGSSTSFTNGKSDVYLIKMGLDGSVLWQYVYGGDMNDFGFSVTTSNDSGYIVSGSTESYGAGQDDMFVLKCGKDGELIWAKTYGGPKFESGASVTRFGKGYAIAGNTSSFGNGNEDIYVITIDYEGDTLFTKSIGGEFGDFGTEIKSVTSSVFGITGFSQSFFNGVSQSFLLVTDSNVRTDCFELPTDTEVNSVFPDYNRVSSTVRYGADIFIPKTLVGNTILSDTNVCNMVNAIPIRTKQKPFSIFPNPSIDQFTIVLKHNPSVTKYRLQIFDFRGVEVLSQTIHNQREVISHTLMSGLYEFRISDSKSWYSTRIVVE